MCREIWSTRLHYICILCGVSITCTYKIYVQQSCHCSKQDHTNKNNQDISIMQGFSTHPCCRLGHSPPSTVTQYLSHCNSVVSLAGTRYHLNMRLALFAETPQKPLTLQASAVWHLEPAPLWSVKRLSVVSVRQTGYELLHNQLSHDRLNSGETLKAFCFSYSYWFQAY